MSELLPGAAECLLFAGAIFLLNATPGVDMLLIVSRTLQGGVRAGAAASLGVVAGSLIHAAAAVLGLAALLALHSRAFQVVQAAGAAYLVWLGWGLLRTAWLDRSSKATPGATAAPRRWRSDFRAGVLTNLLNPKIALFFLAFLPQFVPAASPDKTGSLVMLSLWFSGQSLVFLLAMVMLAARAGRAQLRPGWRRGLTAVGGLFFVALAASMLADGQGPH